MGDAGSGAAAVDGAPAWLCRATWGLDQAVAEMAFALQPETHGRSASERAPCRCARLGMMASAVAIILIIVTSATDAARRRVCQLSDYRDVQCAVFRLDPGRVD